MMPNERSALNDTADVENQPEGKRAENSLEEKADVFGLLATGSCRDWDVSIDESIGKAEKWYLEIESSSVYLHFQLANLSVIDEIIGLLERRASPPERASVAGWDHSHEELNLGDFDLLPVSLVGDDEFRDRCFLVIGPKSESYMRLSLSGEDINTLLDALRQVRNELPRSQA